MPVLRHTSDSWSILIDFLIRSYVTIEHHRVLTMYLWRKLISLLCDHRNRLQIFRIISEKNGENVKTKAAVACLFEHAIFFHSSSHTFVVFGQNYKKF